MNRRLALLALGLLVAGGAACNTPVCGAGTKQRQKTNGELECIPADAQPSSILCDVDGGAQIVAGRCVSAISCGPNTRFENGQCVGVGGAAAHVPEACPTPSATQICINGVVRHLLDNSFLAPGEKVRVGVYNPLPFLRGDLIAATLAVTETEDTYLFKDIPLPSLGLVAIGVSDPSGAATPTLAITGTGAQVLGGQSYQVDSYVTAKAVLAAWATQAGDDYVAKGAFITRFFADESRGANLLTATEMLPVAGVSMTEDSLPSTRAKYFGTSLTTVDPALTATSAIGAAIQTGRTDVTTSAFSGTGGGIKWETHPGNSAPGVVFVVRFHPCETDASGACTN